MFRRRVTIASLMAVILFLALVLAGLRAGTTMWMRSIYTATFLTLVYAAIAARYRGAFWYGFSVAGGRTSSWGSPLGLTRHPWGSPMKGSMGVSSPHGSTSSPSTFYPIGMSRDRAGWGRIRG